MEDSTVNHIGFLVKDGTALVAKMQAEGVKVVSNGRDPQGRIYGGYVYSPDGVKIEIIERRTLAVPIQFDQIHFFVADPGPNGGAAWSELQQWYAKEFGVKIERAQLTPPAPGNLASAPMAQSNLSGVNFRFSKQDSKAAPTKGRALDHIGFEIKNLAAFCKKPAVTRQQNVNHHMLLAQGTADLMQGLPGPPTTPQIRLSAAQKASLVSRVS
jgi:catechol 2,3-dioxygenase-like lactoylglutathione lyase family enzyme